MAHGGRRAGSGVKKGQVFQKTMDKALARDALRQIILEHMGEMVASQVAHAKGIKFLMARTKNGGKFERVTQEELDAVLAGQDDGRVILEVWDKDPNVQAFTDLMNRALDKPAEQVQEIKLTGELTLVSRLHAARARLAKSARQS